LLRNSLDGRQVFLPAVTFDRAIHETLLYQRSNMRVGEDGKSVTVEVHFGVKIA
jgi:hypothetical protein